MRSVDDDVSEYERNQQQIDLLRATNPRIERIRAHRDIKVARANSTTQDTRIARYIAAAAAVAIMSVAGCSAAVWGHPNHQKDEQEHQEKMTCIEKHGTWEYSSCKF